MLPALPLLFLFSSVQTLLFFGKNIDFFVLACAIRRWNWFSFISIIPSSLSPSHLHNKKFIFGWSQERIMCSYYSNANGILQGDFEEKHNFWFLEMNNFFIVAINKTLQLNLIFTLFFLFPGKLKCYQ